MLTRLDRRHRTASATPIPTCDRRRAVRRAGRRPARHDGAGLRRLRRRAHAARPAPPCRPMSTPARRVGSARHRYDLAEFGLDGPALAERFAALRRALPDPARSRWGPRRSRDARGVARTRRHPCHPTREPSGHDGHANPGSPDGSATTTGARFGRGRPAPVVAAARHRRLALVLLAGACSAGRSDDGGSTDDHHRRRWAASRPVRRRWRRRAARGTPTAPPATRASPTTQITIGYGDDAGYQPAPGLSHQLSDAMKAMISWCNDQGGINGRKVVGNYYDAKVTEVTNAMTQACAQVFMLVGEGWVFDSGQEIDPSGLRPARRPRLRGEPGLHQRAGPGAVGAEPGRLHADRVRRRLPEAVPGADQEDGAGLRRLPGDEGPEGQGRGDLPGLRLRVPALRPGLRDPG